MNLEPLRRLQSKLSVAFVAAAALVLTSCGGGGATSSPNSSGALALLPGTASLYAGVPYTFNIVGGRKPYLVTSSEQTLIELNFTTDSNQFTVVARNPGVVDTGLDPNEVPRRTVNIQVRDGNGTSISNAYNVLQNFFTGYHESYASTCAAGTGSTPPQACSGSDSIVTLTPVSNGALYGNREYQFDKVRGDFQWVVTDPAATPQLVDQIRARTDHDGILAQRLRVTAGAATQLAQYKVTDILTGATTNIVFLIVQQAPVDAISLVPNSFDFSGALAGRCGAGSGDVFVFGGTPPYTVTGSSGVAVSPSTVNASGDKFTLTLGLTASPCQPGTVSVTDSKGANAQVTVNNAEGTGTLPALTASPTTVANLLCGQSANITVVGGAGTLSATSQHPRITATISGNTLTITRLLADPAPPYPTSGSVTVTDGTTILTIGITATPGTC